MNPRTKVEAPAQSTSKELKQQHLGPKRVCGANYSLLLYLPKAFTEQNKITAGSHLDMIMMNDGSLLLRHSTV